MSSPGWQSDAKRGRGSLATLSHSYLHWCSFSPILLNPGTEVEPVGQNWLLSLWPSRILAGIPVFWRQRPPLPTTLLVFHLLSPSPSSSLQSGMDSGEAPLLLTEIAMLITECPRQEQADKFPFRKSFLYWPALPLPHPLPCIPMSNLHLCSFLAMESGRLL